MLPSLCPLLSFNGRLHFSTMTLILFICRKHIADAATHGRQVVALWTSFHVSQPKIGFKHFSRLSLKVLMF
jgi:hypothetical protein